MSLRLSPSDLKISYQTKFVVFSTDASRYFARNIARELDCPLGTVERKVFDDGEQYYRIQIDTTGGIAGKDVIYVASTNTDAALLELYRVGCALASYGTRRRFFVIPYFGYSTMERAVKPGEVITAKTNARMLSSIPNSGLGNVFLFCDLHVSGLLQYFEGPCQMHEVYGQEPLIAAIAKELGIEPTPPSTVRGAAAVPTEEENPTLVFGSADLGRPLWVESFAKRFNAGMAFIRKKRNMNKTEVQGVPIGDVRGKKVVIYDDMTRTAGTLIKAAVAYLANGATEVIAVLSHLALANQDIVRKIEESPIKKVIATNSHPMSQDPLVKKSKKIVIVPVDSEFVKAIKTFLLFDEKPARMSPDDDEDDEDDEEDDEEVEASEK